MLRSFGHEVEGARNMTVEGVEAQMGVDAMKCHMRLLGFFFLPLSCKKAAVCIGKSFELGVKISYVSTS